MNRPAGAPRCAQRIEDLCAAVIRALTGDAALHYRGGRLHREGRPVPVKTEHLQVDPEVGELVSFRGAADGIALRLLRSDAGLHRSLRPEDPVERALFGLLEQLRVESLAPAAMPGVASNLYERFACWSRAFHRSRLTEGRVGLVVYTLAQMSWSRLQARPVLEETEEYIEGTRAKLVNRLGSRLVALRHARRDQAAYAKPARDVARIVARMVCDLTQQQEGNPAACDADVVLREAFAILLDFADDGDAAPDLAAPGHGTIFGEVGRAYRVYTTRYDREVAAGSLLRAAQSRKYRERLDRRIAAAGIRVGRLARLLGAVLSVSRPEGTRFGEEDGYIDGRRLAQLVSSPAERRIFTAEQRKPAADCSVGFLIDCSGSMKQFSEEVAVIVDLMVRALERCGVVTEVLGFTTGAWNGGRARRDWIANGCPRYPGRLNELCHIVFKDADRSWRRERPGIATLFKRDLFREGVDGEAIEWACTRMAGRGEERRILIVISDGCPMDSATNRANDDACLDRHLQKTVARWEARGDVELRAIGVGLDPSPYYRHSLAIDLSRGIDEQVFTDIVGLVGRPGRGANGPGWTHVASTRPESRKPRLRDSHMLGPHGNFWSG